MAVNNIKNPGVSPAAIGSQASTEANKAGPTAATKQAVANNYNKAAAQAPTAKDAANVQISQKAREMSLAKKVLEDTPDVREDKVARLKAEIESGKYKADAGKIADGILFEAIKDEVSKNPDVALE